MRLLFRTGCCVLFGLMAYAQSPAGLAPDWDMRPILQEMSAHAGRLLPLLDQVDTKAWVQKGASETFTAQLQSAKDQARAIQTEALALAQTPEKLAASLQLYFRIQGLDTILASIEEGTRKYQNPALAQALTSLNAENGANRDRFQVYIVSLATQREQECAVMDREAQRCRSIMATQPPAGARNSGKKK